MSWQLLALVCSLSYAAQNLVVKWLTLRGTRVRTLLWFMFAAGVPFLFVIYYYTRPHPIQPLFYVYFPVGLGINLVAFYGYVRSIQQSEVSLVMPLISLSPLFMLLTSWMILGEFPDIQGLAGIMGVVLGTYFLAKEPGMTGLDPLKTLFFHPGTRWALAVSVLWSVTSNIDKLVVLQSSPFAYTFWFHGVFTLLWLPVFFSDFLPRLRESGPGNDPSAEHRQIHQRWMVGSLAVVGILQALMASSQMTALIYTDVTYVIAVKRGGMLVSVLAGGWLFDEPHTPRRFVASTVVFVGLLGILLR